MKKEIVELLNNRVTNSLKENVESKHRIKELEDEIFDQMKAFAMSVIEVVDITDKVISHFGERMEGTDKISLSIFKKYKVIQKRLLSALRQHGIEKIEFPENKLVFGQAEVLETEQRPDKENEEIISVIQNGYIRGEDVIRPAKVISVKNN
jgi:molecular chaperone GrpE (heat shock protein)